MNPRMGVSIVIMLISLLVVGSTLMQAEQPALWLSIHQTSPEGQAVEIHVTGAQQVYGWSFRLTFDPAAAEVLPANGVPNLRRLMESALRGA